MSTVCIGQAVRAKPVAGWDIFKWWPKTVEVPTCVGDFVYMSRRGAAKVMQGSNRAKLARDRELDTDTTHHAWCDMRRARCLPYRRTVL